MADQRGDGDAAVRAKIAELKWFGDVAARLHEIIVAAAPQLQPRLWYGMPGYAPSKSKPVICFFRVDGDDYVTLGLTEKAHHEPDATADHQLMPSAWFLTDLDPATEARITEIVQRAAG